MDKPVKKPRTRRCVLCCSEPGPSISLLEFPSDVDIGKKWADFCGISFGSLKKGHRLCSQHFSSSSFKRQGIYVTRKSLIPSAVPSINAGCSSSKSPVRGCRKYKRSTEEQRTCTKKKVCFICGALHDNVRRFRFPKDPNTLQIWLDVCGLKIADLKDWYCLCEFHFSPTDIRMLPMRPRLRKGAVPVQFHPAETKSLEAAGAGEFIKTEDPWENQEKSLTMDDPLRSVSSHIEEVPANKFEATPGLLSSLRTEGPVLVKEEPAGDVIVESTSNALGELDVIDSINAKAEPGNEIPFETNQDVLYDPLRTVFLQVKEEPADDVEAMPTLVNTDHADPILVKEEPADDPMVDNSPNALDELVVIDSFNAKEESGHDVTMDSSLKEVEPYTRFMTIANSAHLTCTNGDSIESTNISHEQTDPSKPLVKKTNKKSHLDVHKRSHSDGKPFACKLCDYKGSQLNQLKCHMKSHSDERMFACDLCNYRCKMTTDMKRHKMTHTGEKPYACDVCDYRCNEPGRLKRHKMIHTGEKNFACELCEYRSSEAIKLKAHLRTHTGERPYSCDVCQNTFTESGSLKRHMRIHTGEKPYACHLCNFKYSDARNLKSHVMSHTGEKPYACEFCAFRSPTVRNLKKHLMSHTGERPFGCDSCSASFMQACDLKRHMRTHTLEKPFACGDCDFKSSRSIQLKKHIVKVHNNLSSV